MKKEEWDKTTLFVLSELREHLCYFVTPISRVVDHDYGEHHGSGSYLKLNKSIFLITNEHVAREIKMSSLAHQFVNSEDVFKLTNNFVVEEYPIDVAISSINSKIWINYHKDSLAIPIDRFALKHEPVDGELLFIIGYSGDGSRFLFNTLFTNGVPYMTQLTDVPDDFGDPNYHFALEYRPDRAIQFDNDSRGLPLPPGFSGSLVWNSRFVECMKNDKEWSPQEACVTGIVWGWPSSNACLLATKIEHLNLEDLCLQA